MNTNFFSHYYHQLLTEKLQEAGLTKDEIENALSDVDSYIFESVLENYIDDLSEEDYKKVIELVENNAQEKDIVKTLNITTDEFTERVLHALEQYIHNLTKNLPDLTEQLAA